MLNTEQEKAFQKGVALYKRACGEWENPNCDARLNCLAEALETLGEYVDEVDDVFYRVIFANVIQDIQDTGIIELTDECQTEKIMIYLNTLKWCNTTSSFAENMLPYLWSVLNKLARILLNGTEGIAQNDNVARICYCNLKKLGYPLADIFLENFAQNQAGEWFFTGIRPE